MKEEKESIIKKRTYEFALKIIDLYKMLTEKNEYVLSKQLLKAGTSIGANVEEALAGQSRADFLSKMSIVHPVKLKEVTFNRARMALTDVRLNQLTRIYIDGIPVDLASLLLPVKSWLKFSLLSHIHLHAKSQKHFADKQMNVKNRKVNKLSLLGIIDNLNKAIEKLNWHPSGTEWADYYDSTNYSSDAFEHKKAIISEYLERINPKTVWDFGANTGVFSKLASDKGISTVSFDVDPAAVEFDLLFHRGLVRPTAPTQTGG